MPGWSNGRAFGLHPNDRGPIPLLGTIRRMKIVLGNGIYTMGTSKNSRHQYACMSIGRRSDSKPEDPSSNLGGRAMPL